MNKPQKTLSPKIDHWKIICDYTADKDGDIRQLDYYIKKGDRVRLQRKMTVQEIAELTAKEH